MGIGIWELVLLLLIVVLVFGTKKLKTIGGDLGGAIKSFRSAMNEPEEDKTAKPGKLDGESKAASDNSDKA